jgi:hypothetical protein
MSSSTSVIQKVIIKVQIEYFNKMSVSPDHSVVPGLFLVPEIFVCSASRMLCERSFSLTHAVCVRSVDSQKVSIETPGILIMCEIALVNQLPGRARVQHIVWNVCAKAQGAIHQLAQ